MLLPLPELDLGVKHLVHLGAEVGSLLVTTFVLAKVLARSLCAEGIVVGRDRLRVVGLSIRAGVSADDEAGNRRVRTGNVEDGSRIGDANNGDHGRDGLLDTENHDVRVDDSLQFLKLDFVARSPSGKPLSRCRRGFKMEEVLVGKGSFILLLE